MRRIVSLSVAAITALVGTAIHAQPADREAAGPGDRTRPQAALFADRMFDRIDADRDSGPSPQERRSQQVRPRDSLTS